MTSAEAAKLAAAKRQWQTFGLPSLRQTSATGGPKAPSRIGSILQHSSLGLPEGDLQGTRAGIVRPPARPATKTGARAGDERTAGYARQRRIGRKADRSEDGADAITDLVAEKDGHAVGRFHQFLCCETCVTRRREQHCGGAVETGRWQVRAAFSQGSGACTQCSSPLAAYPARSRAHSTKTEGRPLWAALCYHRPAASWADRSAASLVAEVVVIVPLPIAQLVFDDHYVFVATTGRRIPAKDLDHDVDAVAQVLGAGQRD